MWYFTADLHLNHPNILKYSRRMFLSHTECRLAEMADEGLIPMGEVVVSEQSTRRMTEHIIESINAVVSPSDSLVIAGDFCMAPVGVRQEIVARMRAMINCENLYLILGNHDDRAACAANMVCLDNYTFNVQGQQVFVSHYPCRSWNMSLRGSWMLYGHAHGSLSQEDSNGYCASELDEVRRKFLMRTSDARFVDDLLLDMISSRRRLKTLDVGVDARSTDVRFGTPWSFDEIRKYMSTIS